MSVRVKIITIIGLTFILLLGVLSFTSQWFLIQSSNSSDEFNTSKDAARLQITLNNMISDMDSNAGDWAPWDDTYEFIVSGDPEYVASNLSNQIFLNLGVEAMVFVNTQGKIVFGKHVDLASGRESPVSENLIQAIQTQELLTSHRSVGEKISGILVLPEGPMIVASQPIITSLREGPIRGTLIMGRMLNDPALELLSNQTQLSITSYLFNAEDNPEYVIAAKDQLVTEGPIFVTAEGRNIMAGYLLINDIEGKPALILKIDAPRETYFQSVGSLNYFRLALLVIGITSMLVIMRLLENLVTRRLTELNANVMKIAEQGSTSLRVDVKGNDEISMLADGVNSMLNSLEQSREREREIEERYKNLAAISPVGIFQTDVDGNYVYVNQTWCKITGLSRNEALGRVWFSTVQAEDRTIVPSTGQLDPIRAELLKEEYRFQRPDGTIAWVMQRITPELDNTGNILGHIGTLTDITERKQAEKDLAQTNEQLKKLRQIEHEIASRMVEAQEKERRHISRELHDDLGQSLTAHMLNLKNFKSSLPNTMVPLRETLDSLISETADTIGRMRTMAQNLRPPMLETLNLASALENYCNEFTTRAHISLAFESDPIPQQVTDMTAITLYRFLQEALTNVARHAQAGKIWVELTAEENWLSLTVQDNGIGFEENAREHGIGLKGLQERLTLVGGTLTIHSTPGRGTILTARLPLENQGQAEET